MILEELWLQPISSHGPPTHNRTPHRSTVGLGFECVCVGGGEQECVMTKYGNEV